MTTVQGFGTAGRRPAASDAAPVRMIAERMSCFMWAVLPKVAYEKCRSCVREVASCALLHAGQRPHRFGELLDFRRVARAARVRVDLRGELGERRAARRAGGFLRALQGRPVRGDLVRREPVRALELIEILSL